MLNQSIFGEDAYFQRGTGAAVKYEVVELLNNACPRFVSQHERTVALDYAEFVEFREMLDCFPLGTVGDSENEHTARFQHLPDILERPAYRRHDVFENVRGNDEVLPHEFRCNICRSNIKSRFLVVIGVLISEFF